MAHLYTVTESTSFRGKEFHSYRGTLYNGKLAPKFWVGAPKFRVWAHKFRVGAPKFGIGAPKFGIGWRRSLE